MLRKQFEEQLILGAFLRFLRRGGLWRSQQECQGSGTFKSPRVTAILASVRSVTGPPLRPGLPRVYRTVMKIGPSEGAS